MKKKYYIITAVVSYFLLLIATIPAKSITDIIGNNSPITLHGVRGTLWNGNAHLINVNNVAQLNNTQWSVSIWQILTGKITVDTTTRYADQSISAQIGSSFLGRLFINNFNAKISAEEVAELAEIPLAQLSGMITINIEHAEWKQGELPLANGEINWNNAAVTVADTATLGNVTIALSESDSQLLVADISNQGGDINIDGSAELVAEANYLVDIKLKPTTTANNNIKQSLGLIAKKQNNGEYLLQYSGALNQIGI